jgi:hypothetical protein
MAMAYLVIKIIKGRQYQYLQRSWREGKRVRTQAVSLGPLGGILRKRRTHNYSPNRDPLEQDEVYKREMARLYREEEEFEEWQRKTFGETGIERAARQRQEKLDSLHEAYGLRIPSENQTPQAPPSDTPTEK